MRTVRQEESGLGLEAQRSTVEAFARQHGGAIVASFVEVKTGKWSDRPELAKALDAARKGKATLLIAKLDRLARNVAFIANLMDAGVEFLACDQPFASRLTLHILAAVARGTRNRPNHPSESDFDSGERLGIRSWTRAEGTTSDDTARQAGAVRYERPAKARCVQKRPEACR
jgi:DNA invertase Pin-like site-specific DNA recombinase